MHYKGFDFDIESILDCPEKEEFNILHRLSTHCQEFRSRLAAEQETFWTREKENIRECETLAELITQLRSAEKDKVAKLDDIILQQKVTDKKIAITAKQQTALREEINKTKSLKECISLETVDLYQEFMDNRKLKKDRWNAIKMACSVYKDNLNFYIDYQTCQDHDVVKVIFFKNKNPDRDNYYVNLLNYKNSWQVGEIEPALKEIHSKELKSTIDVTKPLDVTDVIVYLCKLRNLFSKHYIK